MHCLYMIQKLQPYEIDDGDEEVVLAVGVDAKSVVVRPERRKERKGGSGQ